MEKLNVLAFSGSLRTDSYNRKALQIAKRFASEWGANVTEVDLRELDLPIYDGDIEAKGFPKSVLKIKAAVKAAEALLIASPEYNHSISGALKNAIDWLSRGDNSLNGKVAAVFGASAGGFGTVRAQPHLRQILEALNVLILPQPQLFIKTAHEAFNSDSSLKDKKTEERLKKLVHQTLVVARKLAQK